MPATECEPMELTDVMIREIIDRQARKHLGMSGEEFVTRWLARTLDEPDRPEVARVASLIPGGW